MPEPHRASERTDETDSGESAATDRDGTTPSISGGPDTQGQYERRFGVEIDSPGEVATLQRLAETNGIETVREWASEGIPVEAMGTPSKMEAYRTRKGTPVPWDVERRNEQSKRRNELVQRVEQGTPAGDTKVPDSVRDVVSSPGQSLDPSVQRTMEDRMGEDFSDVQVHAGPKAAQAADDINAKAFTVGNHVAFNRGEYDPSSPEGQHVIAHELAHVRQQTGGAVSMLPQDDVELEIDPDPELEQEAEETAQRVMSGGELGIQRMNADVHVQRMAGISLLTRLFGDDESDQSYPDQGYYGPTAKRDATAVAKQEVPPPTNTEFDISDRDMANARMSSDVYSTEPGANSGRLTGGALGEALGFGSNPPETGTLKGGHITVDFRTGTFEVAADPRPGFSGSEKRRRPSGFQAALYHSEETGYVLSFAGTDDLSDVRIDASQAVGEEYGRNDQYTTAMDLARILEGKLDSSLSFTGHSLGGGLATASAIVTGHPATTFNTAGVHPETIEQYFAGERSGQLPFGQGDEVAGMDIGVAQSFADEGLFGGTELPDDFMRNLLSEERMQDLLRSYYVGGEPLTSVQDQTGLPSARGERRRLAPPEDLWRIGGIPSPTGPLLGPVPKDGLMEYPETTKKWLDWHGIQTIINQMEARKYDPLEQMNRQ